MTADADKLTVNTAVSIQCGRLTVQQLALLAGVDTARILRALRARGRTARDGRGVVVALPIELHNSGAWLSAVRRAIADEESEG